MLGTFDISASALFALRRQMTTIANNVANTETILDKNGNYNPYRRRFVLFEPGDGKGGNEGVRVSSVQRDYKTPFNTRLMPGHKYANEEGYVNFPNVNYLNEVTTMKVAQRAYEANIQAMEITKSMMQGNLRILG